MLSKEKALKHINSFNALENAQKIADTIDDIRKKDVAMADYLSTVEKGNATWQGYEKYVREANRANEQMTLSAKAGTAIMKGFSFALNVGISALVSWASSLAIQWIDNYIHRVDKAKESMEEITATIADVNSTFQSARKTVADSGKRFAELSQ